MSAGTQLQMAPQTTVVQGGQQTTAHNQDSNMSTGSSHSDKEVESAGTPDKIQTNPRTTPSERKRKRKALDDNSGERISDRNNSNNGGGIANTNLGTNNTIIGNVQHNVHSAKTRVVVPNPETKKINDYFKHSAGSPIRQTSSGSSGGSGGAKSPSSQHGFPMYNQQPPMSVMGAGVVNQEFFKSRNSSNIVSSTQSMQQQLQQCQLQPPPPPPQPPQQAKVTAATQTELSYLEIQERDSSFELSKSKVDELTRLSEEQKCQISAHQKVIDQHKNHINKCIEVVKKLLMEKSNIEKKEARQKCMQNRLRLGQFVTQRVGATFQENWTDGYAFQELSRRQEEIATEREEIDRQKKILTKKRPPNPDTGRKRNNSTTNQQQQQQQQTINAGTQTSTAASANLHNGDAAFLKPDPVAGSYTMQEYYECDEILKLRQNTLKKEDADLQLETEKLERERNLHIRELKRIHNEDQVSSSWLTQLFTICTICITQIASIYSIDVWFSQLFNGEQNPSPFFFTISVAIQQSSRIERAISVAPAFGQRWILRSAQSIRSERATIRSM